MNRLDTQKIQKSIGEKHKRFLVDVGFLSQKAGADYTYSLVRMKAKLAKILEVFKEGGIIDIVRPSPDLLLESGYANFQLFVNGYDKTVYVFTNGRDIIIKDSSFLISNGILGSEAEKVMGVDVDNYDWEDFANRLLDYIHQVIYMRKESYSLKIWGE